MLTGPVSLNEIAPWNLAFRTAYLPRKERVDEILKEKFIETGKADRRLGSQGYGRSLFHPSTQEKSMPPHGRCPIGVAMTMHRGS